MNKLIDFISGQSLWLLSFLPLLCIVVWFAIESRWQAYVRTRNYQELKLLNELREKSIITQEEFEERKEALLST